MLVWDTGSSYGLTPFRSNLINYVEWNILVKDVTKINRVIGIWTTLHKLIESNGQDILLPCIYYHLTQTYVRIFSTHNYNQLHGGHYVVNRNQVTMQLPFNRIHTPVDIVGTNLPVVHNSFVSDHQKRAIGPQISLSLAYSRPSKLDIFGDLNTTQSI